VSAPAAPGSSRTPALCGPYRLISLLARGRGTSIHVAELAGVPPAAQPQRVALKQLELDGLRAAPVERRREFLATIAQGSWPEHTGIAQTLQRQLPPGVRGSEIDMDVDPNAGHPGFVAMELLDGLTLDRFIDRFGRTARLMPSALAAFVLHETTTALAHARGGRAGAIPWAGRHGRLSPRKLMVLRSGDSKLLPFAGMAAATVPLAERRSPTLFACYRPPEQILGRTLDGRADVFAAGALLWELLVGVPLFRGKTEDEAVASVLTTDVPASSSLRPRIPAGLDSIVLRALQRDPERRFPNCEVMAQELARGLPLRETLTSHLGALVDELAPRKESARSPRGDRFETPTPVSTPRPRLRGNRRGSAESAGGTKKVEYPQAMAHGEISTARVATPPVENRAPMGITEEASSLTPPTHPHARHRQRSTPPAPDPTLARHLTLQPFTISRAVAIPRRPRPITAFARVRLLLLQAMLAMVIGFAGGSLLLGAHQAMNLSAGPAPALAPQAWAPPLPIPEPPPPAPSPTVSPPAPMAPAQIAAPKPFSIEKPTRRRSPRWRTMSAKRAHGIPVRPNPFR
jgi:serine/threonine protein kinase